MMKLRTGYLALAAGLAALGACGDQSRNGGAAGDGDDPESGGTVVLAENTDMSQPFPLLFQSSVDANLNDMMFMTLLRGEWQDGRLAYVTGDENPMALARSYEYVGQDSASMRYHLRSDVFWSDGQPITARDVAVTYRLLADPLVASPRQDFTESVDSVAVENDSTVVFHFARRYPEMRFHAGHGIIPGHIYGDVAPGELATHASLQNPEQGALVVSGAYQIDSWVRGQRVVLTRNPHFQPQGYLDRIVLRVMPDATTRLVELSTGRVDWMNGVGFEQIPSLRQQSPNIRFEKEEKRFFDYIAYNPAGFPEFADVDVRRALGMAIDVPAIIAALQMEDYAVPASGPYPPIFADLYDPEAMPPLAHDVEGAKRILASKGWQDGDGDGILEKEGRPFRFTLVTNAGNQRRADVSQIVQQQWRAVGVDVQLQSLEFNTFMDGLINHNFEAALGGWGVGLSADLTGMWGVDSPYNIVSYRDPETSTLFQQALAQATEEDATPYWKQAAAALIEDQPYTWLFFLDQVDGINERVRGVTVDTYGPYQNAWEWWIPRAQQRGGATPAAADSGA